MHAQGHSSQVSKIHFQSDNQSEQVNKQCRNDDLAIFVGDRLEVKEADKD